MARISSIVLAQKQIADYFETSGQSVYTEKDLFSLIENKRREWKLPETTSPGRITKKWTDNGFLQVHLFKLTDDSEELIYLFGNPPIYEIAVALKPKSYISHYPAVYLHELTTQVPKTIYTTSELSLKQQRNSSLTQKGIDDAFLKPQRRSQLQTEYEDYTIVLLSSKHSGRSGVLLSTRYKNAFSYTGLERTLLDITVRPNYAGGAFAVLDAYRQAVLKNEISTNKFLSNLKNAQFTYPYHQSIGFLLDRAGYSGRLTDELLKIPAPFRFYLDYEMTEKSFDEKWKIWYPTGM